MWSWRAPPQNLVRCVWRNWGGFVGAAAQPSAGQARSPQRALRHRRQAGAVNVERGLAPRWVAKPPQNLLARCVWGSWGGFVGAAAQPSAGQARSPQRALWPQSGGWRGKCGEGACPPLGGEAAPKPACSVCLGWLGWVCWGCCAAQRGASPLATTSLLATTGALAAVGGLAR